ncbi:PIN domain-like protein [Terfezia boudieri ATCC MYA-4762]|uniref:PIN domain-like protein n=1 Tax=Terfezia boudieri ATCC MYA-4762 TaxID=1051890 RepID=A0A3N4LNH6_9PEZI|nr:PIN domain-like protein [Terfezia boudieri ATCC MYA-4762]
MGVQGLWTILAPCARPIKLETLAHKRLAVDASIWIYQFLKAVRDKEGNALRNSHVVGFFRRICKLLFFGIKPVFVFDGGAPVLKRQTVAGRRTRREGRKDDALRTAGRLLAMQMKRRAEEEAENRRREREQRKKDEAEGWEAAPDRASRRNEPEEEPMPENPVYVEELTMTQRERRQHRTFRKQDPYHLPDLDMSIESMGAPNDPRIMSPEELAAYAAQFREHGDGDSNMSLYDFSKIDFASAFFISLPISDQYAILSAARLRSRLRMGLSKEQLAKMFPNRLDFSKFQIERVRERNELTQRLMNLNGMNVGGESFEAIYGAGRIAGEKGREYVLVKNDGVEGGWVLGVVGRKEGAVAPSRYHGEKHVDKVAPGENRSNPIVLDSSQTQRPVIIGNDDYDDDEDEFEDIPIEGLNRLPKLSHTSMDKELEDLERQQLRQAIHNSKRDQAGYHPRMTGEFKDDDDSLFITAHEDEFMEDLEMDGLFSPKADFGWGRVDPVPEIDNEMHDYDDELHRALAMSLVENERGKEEHVHCVKQTKGKEKAVTFQVSDDESGDEMNLEIAMKTSKISSKPARLGTSSNTQSGSMLATPFGGLLPFESLAIDFGGSLLDKKKKDAAKPILDIDVSVAKSVDECGFGKGSVGGEVALEKQEDKPLPLPPWFAKATDTGKVEQEKSREDVEAREIDARIRFEEEGPYRDVVLSDGEEADSEIEMIDTLLHFEKIDGELVSKLEAAGDKPLESPLLQPGIQQEIQATDNSSTCDEGIEKTTAKPPIPPPVPPVWCVPESSDLVDYAALEATEGEVAEAAEALDHFSDEEDEELMHQLHEEAEEHARFASFLTKDNIPIASKPSKTTPTAEDYEHELRALRNQRKKDRRDADEVTHTMILECQQLLTLFGLPYITAPMEAEAQCAELIRLGLVDGIVTDDSDCFLFGGARVYKNMFNQAKYVECYLLGDLEKEFGLDRKKLISLAHLLGSDYTDGLPGVGPVTALELLTEFSIEGMNKEEPVAPLRRFREWWEQVQHLAGVAYNDSPDSKFKKKFRKSHATKLYLPMNFPAADVDEAYLKPEVDSDPSTFQWGVPDLDGLRQFLMSTIGWSQEQCDEILVPVVKDMNKRLAEGTQSNITRYFEGSVGAGAFAPKKKEARKSKRMDQAMQKLHHIVSKGNGGSSGPGANGDDDSVAPTPISMKDAASGTSTPKNAPVSRRKNKTGIRKPANGGKRQTKAVSVSSSGSDSNSGPEQVVGSAEVRDGSDAEPVNTGKKRKMAPSAGTRGRRKGGRGAAGGARGHGRRSAD